MNILKQFSVMIMSVILFSSCANDYISVIPMPESTKPGSGEFVLSEKTNVKIKNESEAVTKIGEYLIEKLTEATGLKLSLVKNNSEDNAESIIVRNLDDFFTRIGDQLKRYEFYGVNYAKSLYNPADRILKLWQHTKLLSLKKLKK